MFKRDFIWGVSTAAYQIEGAAFEDGKGLSVWDTFCMNEGNVFDGHNGNIACDHYHRYKEDIKLMKELGVKHYRFSIAWTRIMPEGKGEINQKGVDFYNNLIDELLANSITPFITLFHWDTPQALEDIGGWKNPEISDWFAEYANVIGKSFGDRVKYFITINEPQSYLGGYHGRHSMPPNAGLSLRDMVPIVHNMLLAHGKATIALRNTVKNALISFAPCGSYFYPADENKPSDIEAARKVLFAPNPDINGVHWNISWYSDPIFLGRYPEEHLKYYEKYLPNTWKDDLKIINQPLDFCGQNIYCGRAVTTDENGDPKILPRKAGFSRFANSWGTVSPQSIKWAAIYLYERYKSPIVITENGMANNDTVSLDGKVHDPQRIDYLHRYIIALHEAVELGADINGYFQWSFMDNFEWAKGYNERFGMIYIDYETLDRIPKDSAYWYKDVITNNAQNIIK